MEDRPQRHDLRETLNNRGNISPSISGSATSLVRRVRAQPRGDQIQELREQLKVIAMDDEMAQWNGESPLFEEITESTLPQGFKMPTIVPYKGKIDPQEHVDNFNNQMDLLLIPEPLRPHLPRLLRSGLES